MLTEGTNCGNAKNHSWYKQEDFSHYVGVSCGAQQPGEFKFFPPVCSRNKNHPGPHIALSMWNKGNVGGIWYTESSTT